MKSELTSTIRESSVSFSWFFPTLSRARAENILKQEVSVTHIVPAYCMMCLYCRIRKELLLLGIPVETTCILYQYGMFVYHAVYEYTACTFCFSSFSSSFSFSACLVMKVKSDIIILKTTKRKDTTFRRSIASQRLQSS